MGDRRLGQPVLGAIRLVAYLIHQAEGGQEAFGLPVPGIAARVQRKEVVQKIFFGSIFIQAAHQVGNGTMKIFVFHHRRIEEQTVGVLLDGARLMVRHAL